MRSILVTGGAGFIGSLLTLELQHQFPSATLVVVDDFRSGDFKNLQGFRGDVLAADVSRLHWRDYFPAGHFDAIFHLASITDTTFHDQKAHVHDNVEGFRNLLRFASPTQTPIVYASSAATYGIQTRPVMNEDDLPSPANVYAFTKVQLDHLARLSCQSHPTWKLVGLRYFNVYGMNEFHKGKAASMIYQLYLQMKKGQKPRIFHDGEQRRDFVYVKDVVAITLAALKSPCSTVYNAGSGESFSFNQIISTLNECLNNSLSTEYFENPYPFYQPHTQADMSKAKTLLDFTPQYPPRLGIPEYVKLLEQTSAPESSVQL